MDVSNFWSYITENGAITLEKRSLWVLHSSLSTISAILVNPGGSIPSRMQMFYLLFTCFTLYVKAWEVLDDHFAPWSLSSRPFSGPQHWRPGEIWQRRSNSLGADELCCGPEDSLWFSLSRFPDIQNDTKLCTRTNTSNLKFPAISSYLVTA